MADDPDALFPSGPTTRRGLLSAFGRRAAEALPVPDSLTPRPTSLPADPFDEEPPDWIEPVLDGEELVAEVKASDRRDRACTSGGSARAASSSRSRARASCSTRTSPTR